MTEEAVLLHKQGALAEIRLNRPKALNALSLDMIRDMRTKLQDAFADPAIKSIWLGTTNERSFCAGGDVKALVENLIPVESEDERRRIGEIYFNEEYQLDLLIETSPKPIVVYGQGLIYGGGWGLFAGANLRLASANAQLCMPETQIGFFADVGAAAYLQKNDWKAGTFLALTGLAISADEALALDYLDGIIPPDYAETLKQQLIDGIDVTELAIDASPDASELITDWNNVLALLPDDATLSDWVSIIERESAPVFLRAVSSMATGSPWSTAFTWHYFQRCRALSRDVVLQGEAAVGSRFCLEPDFLEGVRSKLIDKSGEPTWRHTHVESVAIDELDRILNP